MKDGEMLAADCEAMMEAEGFKKSTIKKAKKSVGVISRKTGFGCQIPVLIAAGIFGGILMIRFTELVQNPIMVHSVSMGGLAVGLVLGIIIYMRERQKDIVEIK